MRFSPNRVRAANRGCNRHSFWIVRASKCLENMHKLHYHRNDFIGSTPCLGARRFRAPFRQPHRQSFGGLRFISRKRNHSGLGQPNAVIVRCQVGVKTNFKYYLFNITTQSRQKDETWGGSSEKRGFYRKRAWRGFFYAYSTFQTRLHVLRWRWMLTSCKEFAGKKNPTSRTVMQIMNVNGTLCLASAIFPPNPTRELLEGAQRSFDAVENSPFKNNIDY